MLANFSQHTVFLDLINSKEAEAGFSKSNAAEAELTVSLVKAILAKADRSLHSY